MKVKVMNRMYQMQGYAELRCDKCTSITHLKGLMRQFKAQGFKVHANGR